MCWYIAALTFTHTHTHMHAVNSRVFQLVGEQGASVRQAELRTSMREEGDPAAVTAADETAYIFTTDKLPSQRQLFYQLCDLKDDSLQAIIHSNDGRETTCTVRRRLDLSVLFALSLIISAE